jgi:RNA polymerase sigma factor (sigma-70 family)
MGINYKDKREQLIIDNMGLVYHIAKKYIKPLYQDYEDYIQEGMIGLIVAADRFDDSIGTKFTTYAVPYILGHMKRYRRDNTLVKYSRSIHDKYVKLIQYKLEHPEAPDIELMNQLNIENDIFQIIATYGDEQISSLDKEIEGRDNSSISFLETIPDTGYINEFESRMNEDSLLKIAEDVLITASKLHRAIYDEYLYGLP